MANTLGISISESFLQLGLKDSSTSELQMKSFFLPKVPLPRAMESFFESVNAEDIERIHLHLKSPRFILKRHLGVAPAVLVTSGFEDWLDMNLPVVDKNFRLHPKRAESPLDRDLVFGVSERVSSQGEIHVEVSQDELEFLASKLKMLQVQNVALCFLHSQKNKGNLQKAESFLSEQGFQVFTSSVDSPDEKSRWWNSILAAYLQPFYEEFLQQLREVLPSPLSEAAIEISSHGGLTSSGQLFPMSSLFGETLFIRDQIQQQFGNSGYVTHFGFEDFYSFELSPQLDKCWQSPYGKVAMSLPKVKLHSQQPTSVIEMNFWGVPAVTNHSVGFEPGPMCLGRGLRPTLIDLLFLTGDLKTSPFLGEYFNSKSVGRIKESLIAMCEDPQKELTTKDIVNSTLELAMRRALLDIPLHEKNFFIGPLANFFKQNLRKLEPNLRVEVIEDSDRLPLQTLIERLPAESHS